MVGLEEVKASLESFLCGLLVDFHRELQGQRPLRSGLSKLFIGPPGTGELHFFVALHANTRRADFHKEKLRSQNYMERFLVRSAF